MIILILISVLLTIVVLMQSSTGSGLSGAFGGAGGVGTMFGVRRAADFLSRSTWILAVVFTIVCIALNVFFLPSEATEESIIRRNAEQAPLSPMPSQQQQQAPPSQQQAPAQQTPQQSAPQQQPQGQQPK